MPLLLAWGALCAGRAAGQEPGAQEPGTQETVVSMLVTSVADGSIYFDHGREAGLRVGDRVTLFVPGGGDVEAVVRSVSRSSARAETDPGVPAPPVGTRAEARVVVPQARATSRRAAPSNVPAHPPWERQIARRKPDQPLLVPTFGQRPDERPVTVDGRWYTFGQWSRDRRDDGTNDFLLLRSGLRADVTNGMGLGERTRLAGVFSARRVTLDDAPDQSDDTARLDLASVAFGTEQYAPIGAEVGRFLSPHLPEIGLVDGAEVVVRGEGGVRVGGGIGAYPRPFPARNSGDDVGVHAFVDYVNDDERTFAAALGVQKTWHKGAPDRDLVLLRSAWRPSRAFSVLGNAKLDFYSGSDDVKGRGVELTEAMLQARWTAGSGGLGVTASHFEWPQLKRFEYQFLSTELLRDGRVDRVGVSGWWRPQQDWTLRARLSHFADNNRSGTSANASVAVRDVFGGGSSLTVTGFHNDGSYTSGPGAQVSLRERLGDGSMAVSYRWHRYTYDTLVTGPETYVRQSAELRWSWPLGDATDLDVTGARWFGDGEDAFSLEVYVQWRF